MSPFVKSTWYGEDGYFGIDTGLRLDLALNGVGIRSGGLPRVREGAEFDMHDAVTISLLGKERPHGEVTVFPSDPKGNVFGRIGAAHFEDRVLAVDPAGPSIGVTVRHWQPVGQGWTRLSITGPSGLPVTADVRLPTVPEHRFLTLLSTSAPSSLVASTLVPNWREEERDVEWGDARLQQVMLRPGGLPEYAVPLGGNLGMLLGADVLCRFLTVFDFRGRTIWMRAYPGAV